MSLMKVTVNGVDFVVDAPNRSTAKAFGRRQLDIKIENASGEDVMKHVQAGKDIPKLEVGQFNKPEAEEEEGEQVTS